MKRTSLLGKIHFLLWVIILLSSCAPTNTYVYTGPSFEQRISEVKKIAVIDDACILILPFGKDADYVSIADTVSTESFILDSTRTYLEQKGYQVSTLLSPFVCGFVTPNESFKAAQRRDAEKSDRFAPLYISDSVYNNKEYKQALLKVIRQIRPIFGQLMQKDMTAQTTVLPKISFVKRQVIFDEEMLKSFKVISAATNSEIALFIIGHGGIVSTGKTVAVGLASTILSFGMLSVWPVSALDTWAMLVDLKDGEILWSNCLRVQMNPSNRDAYAKVWPSSILYHLPSRSN